MRAGTDHASRLLTNGWKGATIRWGMRVAGSQRNLPSASPTLVAPGAAKVFSFANGAATDSWQRSRQTSVKRKQGFVQGDENWNLHESLLIAI